MFVLLNVIEDGNSKRLTMDEFICKRGHKRSEVGVSPNRTCHGCAKEQSQLYRKQKPEKVKEIKKKWYKRNKKHVIKKSKSWADRNKEDRVKIWRKSQYGAKYNLTLEQYEKMVELQGGVCALCQRPPLGSKRLAVEHDHKSGRIRGACCFKCNKFLIGRRTEKDIPMLKKLIAYLESTFDGREI